jgi:hypothetical protein
MRRKRIDLDSKSEGISPLGEKASQVQAQPIVGQEAKVDNGEEKTAISDKADNEADQGHRYGNFRNYYTFHPPSNRIQRLGEILDYGKLPPFVSCTRFILLAAYHPFFVSSRREQETGKAGKATKDWCCRFINREGRLFPLL